MDLSVSFTWRKWEQLAPAERALTERDMMLETLRNLVSVTPLCTQTPAHRQPSLSIVESWGGSTMLSDVFQF